MCWDLSGILTFKQSKEIRKELKIKNPEMRELTCLLRLHEEDFSLSNLQDYQRQLWKKCEKSYNWTLVILTSLLEKNLLII